MKRGSISKTKWDKMTPAKRRRIREFAREVLGDSIKRTESPLKEEALVVDVDGSHFKHVKGGKGGKGWGARAEWNGKVARLSVLCTHGYLNTFLGEPVPDDFSNPTMELCAAANALRLLRKAKKPPHRILIRADYNGVEKYGRGYWTPKNTNTAFQAAARALVRERDLLKKRVSVIDFRHVKGHSGVKGNEEADQLAKSTKTFETFSNLFPLR